MPTPKEPIKETEPAKEPSVASTSIAPVKSVDEGTENPKVEVEDTPQFKTVVNNSEGNLAFIDPVTLMLVPGQNMVENATYDAISGNAAFKKRVDEKTIEVL